MGQYHCIYNLDKKEYFSGINSMAKIWEKVNNENCLALLILMCNSNGRGGGDLMADSKGYNKKTGKLTYTKENLKIQKAIEKIQGRWAGNKILVQGDYAKQSDPNYTSDEILNTFTSIDDLVSAAICPFFKGEES